LREGRIQVAIFCVKFLNADKVGIFGPNSLQAIDLDAIDHPRGNAILGVLERAP
jgi:hypothetical protein